MCKPELARIEAGGGKCLEVVAALSMLERRYMRKQEVSCNRCRIAVKYIFFYFYCALIIHLLLKEIHLYNMGLL